MGPGRTYVKLANAEDLATGLASAAQVTAHPAGTTHVRLVALTNPCRVQESPNGVTAAGAADYLLPVGQECFLPAFSGGKITAIQEGAAGKVNIMPVAFY